jgi:hypothetical protein
MENFSVKTPEQTQARVEFLADISLLQKFDIVRRLHGRSRSQMMRMAMKLVTQDQGRQAEATCLDPLPEFQTLTIKEARAFLAPYFDGRPPSEATLERRIEDGILVADKGHDGRTTPRRILKASLVAWLRRMGKELTQQFAD